MPISNTKRKLIWELYGGRCVYCHTSVAFVAWKKEKLYQAVKDFDEDYERTWFDKTYGA